MLILTARGVWTERVEGINAGADDYLPKPFEMEELIARLRALLRRSAGQAAPVLMAGPLTLDTRQMRISLRGVPVDVSPLEYRLMAYLMHHAGRVVPPTELAEHLYDSGNDRDPNAIEVIVARLRRKLGSDVDRDAARLRLSGAGQRCMRGGSIRLRLWSAAAVSILIALAIAGVGLRYLFERHVERRVESELTVDLNLLIAAAGFVGQDLTVPPVLTDPRFDTPLSGYYWQVEDGVTGALTRSRSLWDTTLKLPEDGGDGSAHLHEIAGPGGTLLIALERRIIDDATGNAFRAVVAEDHRTIEDSVREYVRELAPALASPRRGAAGRDLRPDHGRPGAAGEPAGGGARRCRPAQRAAGRGRAEGGAAARRRDQSPAGNTGKSAGAGPLAGDRSGAWPEDAAAGAVRRHPRASPEGRSAACRRDREERCRAPPPHRTGTRPRPHRPRRVHPGGVPGRRRSPAASSPSSSGHRKASGSASRWTSRKT